MTRPPPLQLCARFIAAAAGEGRTRRWSRAGDRQPRRGAVLAARRAGRFCADRDRRRIVDRRGRDDPARRDHRAGLDHRRRQRGDARRTGAHAGSKEEQTGFSCRRPGRGPGRGAGGGQDEGARRGSAWVLTAAEGRAVPGPSSGRGESRTSGTPEFRAAVEASVERQRDPGPRQHGHGVSSRPPGRPAGRHARTHGDGRVARYSGGSPRRSAQPRSAASTRWQ
jgi:hypothetical protein